MKKNRTHFVLKFGAFPITVLLMVLFFATKLQANDIIAIDELTEITQDKVTLMGKVTDTDDNALEGVVVKDANGNLQTSTDADGKFSLNLQEPTVITFSKEGFLTYQYEFTESDSNLVVILNKESNELVVGGYGSFSHEGRSNEEIIDYLKGLQDKKPLYIINGEKMNVDYDLNDLTVSDIESIVVLKDTADTAGYGSEAEFGVIQINLKSKESLDNEWFDDQKNDTTTTMKKEGESSMHENRLKESTKEGHVYENKNDTTRHKMNKDKSSDMKRGGMDHHMMNHDGDTTRKMDYDKSMGKNKMDSLRMKDHHMMRGDTSKMELKYNNPYQSDDKNVLKVDTAKNRKR